MDKKIPLLKVHQVPHLRFLESTLNSGYYAEGERVIEFEDKISEFVGNCYSVALNSGTAALYLALYMAGVQYGKVVISTPMTSPATNISIPRLGGKILWADVDEKSGNIKPDSVKKLIDKYEDKVAAVIAVDWGGMPCDYDELRKAINGRAYLIEDAAHALCSEYKGQKTGSYADFTCFSFQAVKHITTGDGGLLTVLEKNIYRRAKRLRWFGIDRARTGRAFDDDLIEAGFKFHMNDVAASIGLAQIEDLPEIVRRRKQIASYYENELKGIKFQEVDYDASSSYWLFTIITKNRSEVIEKLNENGVDASPLFTRNDSYTALVLDTLGCDNLKNTKKFNDQALCIPVGEWLTDDDVEMIVKCLNHG